MFFAKDRNIFLFKVHDVARRTKRQGTASTVRDEPLFIYTTVLSVYTTVGTVMTVSGSKRILMSAPSALNLLIIL